MGMDRHDDLSSESTQDEADERGWEDVDPEEPDDTEFVSLFDDEKFTSATLMLEYCKDKYGFDIWSLHQKHDLDFLEAVKLVNYIRSQVKAGNTDPPVADRSLFSSDEYLKPVLEDDALLYSLDDVFVTAGNLHAKSEVDDLRDQLETLKAQFQAYRDDVQNLLQQDLKDDGPDPGPSTSGESKASKAADRLHDDDYFRSYSYNSIHETMLKDAIRTDAYRDFIYDNKDLFRDKTVLDVGCGSGILSMFCARAGAKLVIAVDNSGIIDKAKENVRKNNLQDQITFVRGKIEEVELPVPQVDIIVSEWMGYCLLYESMLDSVLYARDKYLTPNGLMVPSCTTIRMSPLADSELKASHVDFWRDVYGFDMTPMLEKAHEEALIRVIDSKDLAADSALILRLDLHTATVKDLDFRSSFEFEWKDEHELLEGFVIWFDTFFSKSREKDLSTMNLATEKAKDMGHIAFSTGPHSTPTHWQQGVLLIKDPKRTLKAGERLRGEVGFKKHLTQERSLNIDVLWYGEMSRTKDVQMWFLD